MKANNEILYKSRYKEKTDKFKVITGIITIVLSTIAIVLTIVVISDKRKSDEITVQNNSIQCSIGSCGKKECVDMYASRFTNGDGLYNVLKASESAKISPSCLKQSTDNRVSLPTPNNGGDIVRPRAGSINVTGGSVSGNSIHNGTENKSQ